MAVERIIGVDFGTSTSVIRVKRYENGEPIGEKLETKEVIYGGMGSVVPTLVQKSNEDASKNYFGYEARQKKKNYTGFHSFKMNLESSDPAKRDQARLLTEEFYGYLCKQYKSQSEGGHLGDFNDKERTIISYPVKWSEETKNFMLEAAKKAGFPNVTGMDEAQAAIQAVIVMSTDHLQKHGLLKNGIGTNILLIDMGAGTTDLVLARYVPGDEPKTEVLNTWPKSGDIQFGGREIDALLQNFFREKMSPERADSVFRIVGADKFKSWKELSVSPMLADDQEVMEFSEFDAQVDYEVEYCLDRTAFENCLADYLKQFPELVNGCLQDAGMSGSDVDLVIVTGGHSQWYFVNEMLCGKMTRFGNLDLPKIRETPARIIPISRPQETVALGLAYSGIHLELSAIDADDEQNRKKVMDDQHNVVNEIKNQKQNQLPEPDVETDDEDFVMVIHPQGVCNIENIGLAVKGTVMQGSIKEGDHVYICGGRGQPEYVQICSIRNRKFEPISNAQKGTQIYLMPSGKLEKHAFRSTFAANRLNYRPAPPSQLEPAQQRFDFKLSTLKHGTHYPDAKLVWATGTLLDGKICLSDTVYVCGNTGPAQEAKVVDIESEGLIMTLHSDEANRRNQKYRILLSGVLAEDLQNAKNLRTIPD